MLETFAETVSCAKCFRASHTLTEHEAEQQHCFRLLANSESS